jgi:glycosyltransferase involved in cell wall biosynthesis
LNIGIIGTRGIPNRYGGFEQLAERLSAGLLQKGHRVTVYNSHRHPYQLSNYGGVVIVHCYDAEYRLGNIGQFIYDLNCIRDARKRKFDVLLFLGYTSSSLWGRWYPGDAVIISNMDGMEWKRKKYPKPVRRFLRHAEKWAVSHSDYLIADSPVMASYMQNKYGIECEIIAYGADTDFTPDKKIPEGYGLEPDCYFMIMARMEPENNIDTILEGFHGSKSDKRFVVLGNTNNRYGSYIKRKYHMDARIHFTGAVFDTRVTHSLMAFCCIYFHGHSAGGTNPSLLEAMAAGACISAHDNDFNRAVLQADGLYFSSSRDVCDQVEMNHEADRKKTWIKNNGKKIRERYNWMKVVGQYDAFFSWCIEHKKK